MVKKIQAVRGMHDILPSDIKRWHRVEQALRTVLAAYGYSEIRLPILESTALFHRSIGEVTDIVEKEMYTFDDRNGDSLTLRPEGTAGCLRACIEHGLLHNQIQRLWYKGPMFRHERPQKGRYRQFYQVGVETYGMQSPEIDAELILLTRRLWNVLGVSGKMVLQLNSLGSANDRMVYRERLVEYFSERKELLDEDSLRRLKTNPLRILDSKNPEMRELIDGAPVLSDYLGDQAREHFDRLCEILDKSAVEYCLNPRLVRGLDYYCNTVFEWVTEELGAQGTVCAGGRYDGLVEQLGGRANSAVGFAMGLERLVSLLENTDQTVSDKSLDIFLIRVGAIAENAGLALAENLRDALPDLRVGIHCGGGSFKSQFKRADKTGADYALILADDEIAKGVVGIKPLRRDEQQVDINQSDVVDYLRELAISG